MDDLEACFLGPQMDAPSARIIHSPLSAAFHANVAQFGVAAEGGSVYTALTSASSHTITPPGFRAEWIARIASTGLFRWTINHRE